MTKVPVDFTYVMWYHIRMNKDKKHLLTTLKVTKKTLALVRRVAGLYGETTEEAVVKAMTARLARANEDAHRLVKEAQEKYIVNRNE